MVNKDLIRLRHMSDSAIAILAFIQGKSRENLDTDRLLLSGILRELEILGEAAGKISQQTKDAFPEFPWKQMIGMRNRLIHAYFDVDHDIVWKTIKDFLPSFTITLSKIIVSLETRK
jgi:uncharacterized protein with HEPN domain